MQIHGLYSSDAGSGQIYQSTASASRVHLTGELGASVRPGEAKPLQRWLGAGDLLIRVVIEDANGKDLFGLRES